jgi:hypothetical protein
MGTCCLLLRVMKAVFMPGILPTHLRQYHLGMFNCRTQVAVLAFNPGNPQEWGVGQVFDLYFPTDYHSMSYREVYVVESRTGSIWHVDFATSVPSVPKYYQDQRLIGQCPRVHFKGDLWFTQDGNMMATTGPGVGDGVSVCFHVSAGVWNAVKHC